ncbi:MAG: stage III sporulation protein AD [Ruminococcaceae bacterium]|nr:stage III sporulation protein AD [Oscillospiraceae bacterium]
MIIKIAVLAAVTAIAALSFKRINESVSVIIIIAASVMIAAFILANMVNAIGDFSEIFTYTGMNGTYLKVIIKCLGISLVAELAADICEDAGYTSMAAQIILAGKIAIVMLALPLLKAVLEMSMGLIQA